MRETRHDTKVAVVLALLLHLVPAALLLLVSLLPGPPPGAAGEPIHADVVDPDALSAATRSALRTRPRPDAVEPTEPPKEEVPPEALPEALEEAPETPPEAQPLPQEQLPDPDTADQAAARADALAAETAEREQEEKRRQGQVDLTAERERQEAEQRKTEMQRQREQQLADIQRQREQNQREIAQTQQRLDELARQRAQQASAAAAAAPPPGSRGVDPNLSARYSQALIEKIRSNWVRPDNVSPDQICKIVIRQIPNGTVIDTQVDPSCPYDEVGRRSIEAAVMKAQPLPYQGFESVFNRTLILRFRADEP